MTGRLTGSFRGHIHAVVERHRRDLLRMERESASEMVRQYGAIWTRLSAEIQRIAAQYHEADEPGVSWVFQQRRLEELLRQVEAELRTFADYAEAEITASQQQAVDAAAQHFDEIMLTATPPGPGVHVRWDRLPVEAISDLVGFSSNGSPLRELLEELGPEASRAVRDGMIQGLALGHNPRRAARAIRGELGGNLVRALRISRTEMLRSYREATRRNYQASSDIIAGWRWSAEKGTRTCAMCFPAGVAVSGPLPEKVFSRHYTGRIVIIETAGGKQLPVTPNHPILTRGGWVKAGLLQEGDNVVCCSGPEGTTSISVDNHHGPLLIEQVAKTFRMIPTEMPCAAPDFHGDGEHSNVYVVWARRLLGDDGDPTLAKQGAQGAFSRGGSAVLPKACAMLKALCSSNTFVPRFLVRPRVIGKDELTFSERNTGTAQGHGFSYGTARDVTQTKTGSNGNTRNAESLGKRLFRLAGQIARRYLRIRQASTLNNMLRDAALLSRDGVSLGFTAEQPSLFENRREALSTDAKSGADFLGRLAGQISTDRILNISIRSFCGHVYNLQTSTGWYIANGIIAHNCLAMDGTFHTLDEHLDDHPNGRCAMVPVLKGQENAGPEWETGSDWLAKQGIETQEKILGKAGAAAYRAGAVQLTDYVGQKQDKDWGSMRYAKSLREVLGKEGAERWRRLAVQVARGEFEPWEIPNRRGILPVSLREIGVTDVAPLAVPRNVWSKLREAHPVDLAAAERLQEILDGWCYAGLSPKGERRLEVYQQLDDVWYTAVIRLANEGLPLNVLVTFHRVYAKRVASRVARGYLARRA